MPPAANGHNGGGATGDRDLALWAYLIPLAIVLGLAAAAVSREPGVWLAVAGLFSIVGAMIVRDPSVRLVQPAEWTALRARVAVGNQVRELLESRGLSVERARDVAARWYQAAGFLRIDPARIRASDVLAAYRTGPADHGESLNRLWWVADLRCEAEPGTVWADGSDRARCPCCGYSLDGPSPATPCPECGRRCVVIRTLGDYLLFVAGGAAAESGRH